MRTVLMLALLASLAFCGCASNPRPPMDARVTVAENLGLDLFVSDVRCAKGKSDFYSFQANVVNNTRSTLNVEWKVQWLDADGMEIESLVSGWNRIGIAPKEMRGLSGTASSRDAVDMRFYVRRGK